MNNVFGELVVKVIPVGLPDKAPTRWDFSIGFKDGSFLGYTNSEEEVKKITEKINGILSNANFHLKLV